MKKVESAHDVSRRWRSAANIVGSKLGELLHSPVELDGGPYQRQASHMAAPAIKRVTVNLPAKLLSEAEEVSGRGITETIVLGLELLARRRAYARAMALKGKLHLDVDTDLSRERSHR
jgi:hypothetical protein